MKRNSKGVCLTLVVLLLAFVFALSGCGARRTPNLERIFAAARATEGKRPVIVIPGILGSQLVNRRTGEIVWPSVFRSSDDGLSLPVSPNLAANRDDLYAAKIVDMAKLARLAPEYAVYHGLLNALRQYGGYKEGDWTNPPSGGDRDTFYVFAYDWRRDNVESARELVRRVEELKAKLGRPDLRFNIVAHSMGGLIARYAAMYGDADLPPEGRSPVPTWNGTNFINKIFMFGTPNEGSAEVFTTLLEGYSVTEGLRPRVRLLNKLTREDVFTAPAIFQLLPHSKNARFLDAALAPMTIDLYDASVWERYNWSAIHDPDFRSRFTRNERDEASRNANTLEELDAYFAVVLRRAKRFHEALDAPVPMGPIPLTLFAFGGDCEETLAAPVVRFDEKRRRFVTLTAPRSFRSPSGRRFSRTELIRAMYEPGDGRVTRRSLLGETLDSTPRSALYNTSLPLAYAAFACDIHSELQNNLTLQDNVLTLLVSEAMK